VLLVPLDTGFAGAADFADVTFFALLDEVDFGFADPAFLLEAIWDFKSLTAVFAFASFFLVFDSCALSFFFFICY